MIARAGPHTGRLGKGEHGEGHDSKDRLTIMVAKTVSNKSTGSNINSTGSDLQAYMDQ